MIKHNEAVVNAIQTHLLATVSDDETRHDLMSLCVSDPDEEAVHSIVLVVNDQLRPHAAHDSCFGGSANPELHCRFVRCVDDEFLA